MSEQNTDNLQREKRVLAALQHTLSAVVREVTPLSKSLQSPLSKTTTDDIVMCFGLISSRQQEIAVLLKEKNTAKPRYSDQVQSTHNISLESLTATLSKNNNND